MAEANNDQKLWKFIIGVGGLWAWIFLTVDTGISTFSINGTELPWALHFVALSSSCIICAIVLKGNRLLQKIFSNKRLIAIPVSLGIISALLWSYPSSSLQITSAIFNGCSIIWYYAIWGYISTLIRGNRVLPVCASLFVGATLFYFGSLLPNPLVPILASICVLASTILAASVIGDEHDMNNRLDLPCSKLTKQGMPIGVWAGFAVVVFVYSLSRTALVSNPEYDYSFQIPMMITAAVIGVIIMAMGSKWVNLASAYKIAALLTVCASIFALLFCSVYIHAVTALVGASIVLLEITNWLLVIYLSQRNPQTTIPLFVFSRLINHGAQVVGIAIGVFFFPDYALALVIVSVLSLCCVAGFAFPDRDLSLSINREFQDEMSGHQDVSNGSSATDNSTPERAISIDEKALDAIVERFGLSAREKDVLLLWATGCTHAFIEERLVISKSTVKTHIKHIYEKTGVHSKSELMLLIDLEYRQAGSAR